LAGNRTRDGQRLTTRASSDPFGDSLYSEQDFDVVDATRAVAEGKGVSAAQVALAWLLRKPGVSAPIVGATKLSHLEDAIASVDVDLSEDEIAALEKPYRPHAVSGHN
jgi:aryl-alcohol dehydrogenase-like predicted oxidoreductase